MRYLRMINKLLIDKSNNYSIDIIAAWAGSVKMPYIIIIVTFQINLYSAKIQIFPQFSSINHKH